MKRILLLLLITILFPLKTEAGFVSSVKEFLGISETPVIQTSTSTPKVETKDITPDNKKEKTEGGINLKQVNKQTVTNEVKTGDVNVKQADVNVKGGDVSFKTETKLDNTITNWKELVLLLTPLLKNDPKYDSLMLDVVELRDRLLTLENSTSTFIINIPQLQQPNVYVSSPSVNVSPQFGTTTLNFSPTISTPTSTINFNPTIENGTSTINFSPIIIATSSDIINITATSSIDSVTQQLLDIININTQLNATNTVALQGNILSLTGVVQTLQTDLTTLTNDFMSFRNLIEGGSGGGSGGGSVTAEYGAVVLSSQTFSTNAYVTSTNGTFAITSAGTWRLRYDLLTDGSGVNATNPMFSITDNAGAVVSGSERVRGGGSTIAETLTAEVFVTTTGATSYFLKGRIGAASGSSAIINGTGGQSTISWEKISGFVASQEGVWTSYTPAVTAPTTSPTLPTSAVTSANYMIVGKTLFINYQMSYATQGGGTNGTGTYNFSIPAGYTINTTKAVIPSLTGTAADSGYDGTAIGTYQISNSGTNYFGKVVALTTTTVGLFGTTLAGGSRGLRGSTSGQILESTAPSTYSFVAQIPIN